MTSSDRQVLLVTETMELAKPLIGPDYSIVDLWRYPDRAAFLAENAHDIRVVVTAGGLGIEVELVEQLPNLGLIAVIGVGFEGVDVAHAHLRGITVTNGAGSNTEDVADLAVG
ncbi:MAG: 2-hydroxyacid dehydrogenase, partial [Verrucomicrobiaceae bacterium]